MSSLDSSPTKRVPLKDPSWTGRRQAFFSAVGGSFVLLQILFLVNLCYLYGALYKNTYRTNNLHVLMVDYDSGVISQSLRTAYSSVEANNFPTLVEKSSSDYNDPEDIRAAVCRGDYWAAIYTQQNASENLIAALQGGSAASTYDPNAAMTIVWNEVRYPTIAESAVFANLQTLFTTTRSTFYQLNGNLALQSILNTSNASATAATQVLFDPFSYTAINIAPTPQSAKYLLNTASIVMFTLMQFFFILAFNGISTGFQLYTRIPILTHLLIRLSFSVPYTFMGSLLSVVYIWSFKENWALGGGQFVETWMVLWLVMHINFLVLDAAIATLPMSFVPFFTFTWIIVNIASTVMPFEISSGFYRIGYLFPAHSLWEIFIQVWSGGCYNRLYRTLPILFVWELVAFGLDIRCQFQKANAAARDEEKMESSQAVEAVPVRRSAEGGDSKADNKTAL